MSIILKKHNESFVFTGIAKLGFVNFAMALAVASITTVWSLYIKEFVDTSSQVGFVSALLAVVAFVSYFIFVPLIENFPKKKLYFYCLFLTILFYISFYFINNFSFFILVAFVFTIVATLRITSLGIIIRNISKDRNLSRNEGLIYTFLNSGWIIGPLIAGYLSVAYGIKSVFLLSAFFASIALYLFYSANFRFKEMNSKKVHNFSENFKDYCKSKNRIYSYLIRAGVSFWWVLIYVFIPLYIVDNGLSNILVGYFLFAIPIPLILVEYKFSKFAGKYGFKKLFKIGFLSVAIISLACFFVQSIYFVLGLLILASFGMALLEPTTEAYFFHTVKKEDEARFYGPYNTSGDSGNFFAKIFASFVLAFLSFKFIFILFSVMMFLFFVLSFRMQEFVEQKK